MIRNILSVMELLKDYKKIFRIIFKFIDKQIYNEYFNKLLEISS